MSYEKKNGFEKTGRDVALRDKMTVKGSAIKGSLIRTNIDEKY